MKHRLTILAALVVSASPAAVAQRPSVPKAAAVDLLLTGGKVFTADTTHPWAQAIAIRDGRIVAVGTDGEVRRVATRAAREIPLGGRVVIPGINDAHDHLGDVPIGVNVLTSASPTPDPSPQQVLDSIRSVARRTPAGTWIKVTIGQRVMADTTLRRTALDHADDKHPIFLWAFWGHGMVLNSAGLRALGITDTTRDPLGGWFDRDESGRLTGELHEYAEWGALRRLASRAPDRAVVANLRTYADSAIRLGVTSVQDMAGYVDPDKTIRAFRDANLPLRVRVIRWSIPNASGRNEAEWNHLPVQVASRVVVSGRKWVLDATPVDQMALMRRAYRPGWYGRPDFPVDTVRAMLREALAPGATQLMLHTAGDSAAVLVLNLMESLAPDSAWRTRRVRLEHGGRLAGADIARARRLGIVIAQPRSEGAPLRSWFDGGLTVAYGSDQLRNPFYHMMMAVTEPTVPGQSISREAAVTMMTRMPAFAEFMERDKGSLAPGMLADLAVLSQDIFSVPVEALPGTTSVLTVVGGRVVYDRLRR